MTLPATHFASINYNRNSHIKLLLRAKDSLTAVNCSLHTASSVILVKSEFYVTMVLCSLPLPHAFYKLVYLEVIAALHYNTRGGVIHSYAFNACASRK